jgi:chromosomal replication initiation ATPase DnaA|tara:strand:+ start:174 stop:569 length:396 start_codon:yes stop_codon:yes gene_type:complete
MKKQELKDSLQTELNKDDFNPYDLIDFFDSYLISQKNIKRKDVIEAAAKAVGVDVDMMYKRSRKRDVVTAKYLYYWHYRVFVGETLRRIGLEFNIDHSSVLHGVRSIKDGLLFKDELITKSVIKFNNLIGK